MPKVRFTNEAFEVDAPRDASLLDVCEKAGVNVFRGIWTDLHCGGPGPGKLLPSGSCGRCKLWVIPDQPSGVNAPTGKETIHAKIAGMFRLACQVRILGDMQVTTKPGGEAVVENTDWAPDPKAVDSKWMERWRKAKSGGAKDEPEEADADDDAPAVAAKT